MLEKLKNEPVRLYAIAAAALALVAHYVPDIPQGLILALVTAILGVGETVRANVAPMRKVVVHEDDEDDDDDDDDDGDYPVFDDWPSHRW